MSQHTSTDFDVSNVMNYITLTQTLVESFHELANEVQSLTDRKTILEHKLRFAHEQVCRSGISFLGHLRLVPCP